MNRTTIQRSVMLALAGGSLALGVCGHAAAPAAPLGFEGDWVRTDTNESGSFDGLSGTFEKASLTPAGKAELDSHPPRGGPPGLLAVDVNKPHKVGEPYIVVDMPCQGGPNQDGALGISPDSGGIHIIESKLQFVIAPERGGARSIWLDGRSHPDASHWVPQGAGHGVGHYENGEFVVDTVGLPAGRVPADGWRTPETHLGERFKLSEDGQHMTITYTYSDPKIYTKPHTFFYTFDRSPPGSYALEEWCDASDPAERQSIVPPPQD
ncbi:MAG: hypothetical protein QM696_06995 [Steroidobacteraceae bacterium]